ATAQAWTADYQGTAPKAFLEYIDTFIDGRDQYARYLSVINSSGTGKSRMLHEVGKLVAHVSFIVREKESTGYPPADIDVRNYFDIVPTSQQAAYSRCVAFLTSLFRNLHTQLHEASAATDYNGVITALYEISTVDEPQHRSRRQSFYHKVVADAKDVAGSLRDLHSAAKSLEDFLLSLGCDISPTPAQGAFGNRSKPNRSKPDRGGLLPQRHKVLLMLSFDEAHRLTTMRGMQNETVYSYFGELRRALRTIRLYSIFTVFASTTGEIFQFSPVRQEDDPSRRLQLGQLRTIPPFIHMGFDQFMKIATDGMEITELTGIDYAVHLGRPLFATRYLAGNDEVKRGIVGFAAEKLLNGSWPADVKNLSKQQKFACLSARLPLNFTPMPTSLHSEEVEQVEKHLRILLRTHNDRAGIVTETPSEPILALGAQLVMRDPAFRPPLALFEQLDHLAVHRGERGEAIAGLLLLMAMDKARALPTPAAGVVRVTDFLEALLPSTTRDVLPCQYGRSPAAPPPNTLFSSAADAINLRTTFAQSSMHFTHWMSVKSQKVVSQWHLFACMARGAGIKCANSFPGVDFIIPFLLRGDTASPAAISAILIQVKLDKSYGSNPNVRLFDAMDPQELGIFDQDVTMPVVRIVFSLAAKQPSFLVGPFYDAKTSVITHSQADSILTSTGSRKRKISDATPDTIATVQSDSISAPIQSRTRRKTVAATPDSIATRVSTRRRHMTASAIPDAIATVHPASTSAPTRSHTRHKTLHSEQVVSRKLQ
ncbi:uncharacterized protein PHACADRAFT_107241, partial [Phanerochaete carnosa HHB-10118-sp]